MCLVDASYVNEPTKRISTTVFDFIFSGSAVVYRSKTQLINTLSYTEIDIVSAVTDSNIDGLFWSMIWEIWFPQDSPTIIQQDNDPNIDIVNSDIIIERTRHIDVQFFAIQVWKEGSDIIMNHIPGIINSKDDITKPLGWVLHSRHAIYLMEYYNISFESSRNFYQRDLDIDYIST